MVEKVKEWKKNRETQDESQFKVFSTNQNRIICVERLSDGSLFEDGDIVFSIEHKKGYPYKIGYFYNDDINVEIFNMKGDFNYTCEINILSLGHQI